MDRDVSWIWQPVRIAGLRLDAVDFAAARPWALGLVVSAGCLALWGVWRRDAASVMRNVD